MTPSDPTHDKTRTVEISAHTADVIAERLSETEFDSVDDYVSFALEQVLRGVDRVESEGCRSTVVESEASSDTSTVQRGIEDRLESLGYL